MCVAVRTVAILIFLIAGSAGVFAAPAAKSHPKPKPTIVWLDSARKCDAAVVYTEARGEPFAAQLQIGYVGVYRSELNEHGWGGPTVCGVTMSGQFSGIKGKKLVIKEHTAWQRALTVADDVRRGWRPRGELRYATYFLNPFLSTKDNRCWFERALVPIAQVGLHVFYREPLSAENPQPSGECVVQTASR